MPKCLMLDVDGVLVDGRPGDGRGWSHGLLAETGISPEDLRRDFFSRDWQDIVVGKRDLFPSLAACLERLDATIGAEELVAYWFENDSRVVDHVLQECCILRRRGVPVHLFTNQEHRRARYLMDIMGLGKEVDGIIYSAQAGFRKPQAEFFSYAERVLGRAPHELVLVDDTIANVEGARQAGWQAIHWDGSETLSAILSRNMA